MNFDFKKLKKKLDLDFFWVWILDFWIFFGFGFWIFWIFGFFLGFGFPIQIQSKNPTFFGFEPLDKINTNLIRNQIKKPNLENKMNSSYKSFLTQSLERSKMPNSNMSIEEEIASYELLPVSTDTNFSIFWSQNEKKNSPFLLK